MRMIYPSRKRKLGSLQRVQIRIYSLNEPMRYNETLSELINICSQMSGVNLSYSRLKTTFSFECNTCTLLSLFNHRCVSMIHAFCRNNSCQHLKKLLCNGYAMLNFYVIQTHLVQAHAFFFLLRQFETVVIFLFYASNCS